jgi:hypothetical protein
VSTALHFGGGYPEFVGTTGGQVPTTNDNDWYMRLPAGAWVWSNSWSVAGDQFNFQRGHFPGGLYEGSVNAGSNGRAFDAPFTPNSVVTGDALFYDWNADSHIDHMAIQVGIRSDPNNGWHGNVVDQHSTNRKSAFWSLFPYNANWPTTVIYFEHIQATN